MAAMKRLAFRLRVAGVRRWGAKALWETLRYDLAINSNSQVGMPVLNNNFTAWFARRLMEEEPDLEGFFETRERKSTQLSQ